MCEIGSKILLAFLILNCNINNSCFLEINRVFMALGSAKISQRILRSQSNKYWFSTFAKRNMPDYIHEYQRFEMTRGYSPHDFFQGYVLYWNIRPPFHWMCLIRRLWIVMEYPSESGFNKKSKGTWSQD